MGDVINKFIEEFKRIAIPKEEPDLSGNFYPYARSYRNAAVRLRQCSIHDFAARRDIVKKIGLNVFFFPSDQIPGCDLLSDSGTTTMTMEQWAQLLLGDEAYGSNEGYFTLKDKLNYTFGAGWVVNNGMRIVTHSGKELTIKIEKEELQNLFIFHQGRACEYALFSTLNETLKRNKGCKELYKQPLREGGEIEELPDDLKNKVKKSFDKIIDDLKIKKDNGPAFIIPCNTYFDTTEANAEHAKIIPLNIPCKKHEEDDINFKFRGNINIEYLKELLDWNKKRIPLVYLTITNNAGGGQPVSMENIKATIEIAHANGIPVFFDACRFAENAWFIKKNEKGYESKDIKTIIHEMFKDVDGFHVSFKKDGLVNMGGAILINNKKDNIFTEKYPEFLSMLTDHQILVEGHPTYGGLAGRDLKGLVEGLNTVTNEQYLNHRISQVNRFGEKLISLLKKGEDRKTAPILQPIGGHAIYLKMDDFFNEKDDGVFKGISLTALLLIAGHRLVELGLYFFGKCKNNKEEPPVPRINYIRAAVPRLTYEDQDLFATTEAIKILYDYRDLIPGVNVEYGQDKTLRHFKSRFSFKV